MIKLSKRMSAVANLVTSGSILCDVGTDHGYVPISLIETEKVTRAIAVDINIGPLERAKEHIEACGLEDKIETRLSDGLAAISPGEVESIIVAGMGGELVLHILSDGCKVCDAAKELILQPQSDIWKVRKYIRDKGYTLLDEDMVYEDGKYYPMMKVGIEQKICQCEELSEEDVMINDIYGPVLLKNRNSVLRDFLEKERRTLSDILEQLRKSASSDKIAIRMEQIEKEIEYNKKAYFIIGEK